jgi:hypothetical protein
MSDSNVGLGTGAWIHTDARARIQAISSAAHDLLGGPRLGRGDDLLSRFPSFRKALLFDMEVALTGWPTERTIVLLAMSRRPRTVRYRVCRKWSNDEIGLFWMLTVAARDERLHCA